MCWMSLFHNGSFKLYGIKKSFLKTLRIYILDYIKIFGTIFEILLIYEFWLLN
jgi:hypothetical protein